MEDFFRAVPLTRDMKMLDDMADQEQADGCKFTSISTLMRKADYHSWLACTLTSPHLETKLTF